MIPKDTSVEPTFKDVQTALYNTSHSIHFKHRHQEFMDTAAKWRRAAPASFNGVRSACSAPKSYAVDIVPIATDYVSTADQHPNSSILCLMSPGEHVEPPLKAPAVKVVRTIIAYGEEHLKVAKSRHEGDVSKSASKRSKKRKKADAPARDNHSMSE